ncbi:MAG: NADH-quinone oxidoreductase subunit H [Candidatus Methylacidiphilales bacterium]
MDASSIPTLLDTLPFLAQVTETGPGVVAQSTLLDVCFYAMIKILIALGVILGAVSYTVLAERKVCAYMQDRVGPNRTGIPLTNIPMWGMGQPIADALKGLLKEQFTPNHTNRFFYILAPMLAVSPALITVCVIPFASLDTVTLPFTLPFFTSEILKPGVIADINVGPIFIFAISSLTVYGIVLAGWASNSKFPFLGGIRSSAQMISYEVSMGLAIIPVFLVTSSMNLSAIVEYQYQNGWLAMPFVTTNFSLSAFILWPIMVLAFGIFLVSSFAETNRMPFDLPESEQELVGGYNTEYGGMRFALFFLGEYAALIMSSALLVTLFFGGWTLPIPAYHNLAKDFGIIGTIVQTLVFVFKVTGFILLFIWVRWSTPRFRYDQLMHLGWKVFLPSSLALIVLCGTAIAAIHQFTATPKTVTEVLPPPAQKQAMQTSPNLSVEVKAKKDTYLLGDPIILDIIIQNTSTSDVLLTSEDPAKPWVFFLIQDPEGRPVKPSRGAVYADKTLKAGRKVKLVIDIAPYYSIHKSGTYKVRCGINNAPEIQVLTEKLNIKVTEGRMLSSALPLKFIPFCL